MVMLEGEAKVLAVLTLIALVAAAGMGALRAGTPPSGTPAPKPVLRPAPSAPDFEPQRVAAGARSFRVYCASCHGTAAQGDGPVARDLKIRPTDLTRLSRRNRGTFPYDRVYRAVDGRDAVRGHGPGSMPVWGLSFQIPEKDVDQEEQAREQIRDLMAYLQSIQGTP